MAKPVKKKNRKRKRAPSEEDDRKEIAKKLRDRYGKKTNSEEITIATVRKSDGTISNPTKHNMTIQRCVQSYLTKLNTPEEPEKFVSRKWLCAFCGLQSCFSDLGDLFGPYYIKGVTFPDYLPATHDKPTSSKSKNAFSVEGNEVYSDVWFHGSCGVWAENLMFFGGKFPRLGEVLQTCWHQKCKVCKKPGASIPIDSQTGHLHYPCAIRKNYQMQELTLRCRIPQKKAHN